MSSSAKRPSRSDVPQPARKRSKPSLPAVAAPSSGQAAASQPVRKRSKSSLPAVVAPPSTAITRARRTPSKAKLESPVGLRPRVSPSRSRMAASRPPPALWTRLLVEAGVVDSVTQIGTQVSRRDGEDGLLGLTVTGRGKTAVEAADLLTQHLVLQPVDAVQVTDDDVIVVLQDALGPRRGTVTCDIVIPRPLWEATDTCRAASRNAAATAIPVMTLRRSALGESGTLLSLLVAPEDVDPGYDVACAVAHMVDVLRAT